MPAKPKHIFALFILALASLLLLYYYPWILKLKSFYFGDISNFYEPYCSFFAENFRQGRLPLWNPYPECGLPQLGLTSPSILYLPNLIFAAVTFSQGLALSLLFHQLVSGIGGYLLISRLGWGRLSASVCGAILAFNGYMFTLSNVYPLVETASWIPICLWSLLNISSRFNGKNMLAVLISSIFIFMLVTSGRPELFIPAFIIFAGVLSIACYQRSLQGEGNEGTGALFTANAASEGLRGAISSEHLKRGEVDACGSKAGAHKIISELTCRASALGFGTLMAAPMLLPAIEWANLSPRAAGFPLHHALRWSANFYDCLALVLQQPLGNVFDLNNQLIKLTAAPSGYPPLLGDAYVGPVVITLAIFAMGDTKWPWKWAIAGMLMLAMTLSLGPQTPLMPWLFTTFPILLVLRYPVKLIYFVVLSLSVLAARGMYLLAAGSACIRYPLVVSVGLWSLIVAGSSWAYLQPTALVPLFVSDYPNLLPQAIHHIGLAGINAAILGIIFCAIAFLFSKGHLSHYLFACLVFLCLSGSMLYDAFSFDRYMTEPDFFEKPSYLKDQVLRLAGTRSDKLVPRVAQMSFLPLDVPPVYTAKDKGSDAWACGADNALYERQLLELSTGIHCKVPTLTTYEGPVLNEYEALIKAVFDWSPQYTSSKQPKTEIPLARFCQMTASEYATTQIIYNKNNVQLLDPHFFKLVVECSLLNVRIYEVVNPLPRAYFLPRWISLSHKTVMDCIANAQISRFDPSRLTLVENDDDFKLGAPPQASASQAEVKAAPAVVPAKFLNWGPDDVILQVSVREQGFLVLTDQYYPGWQAFVDGVPTKIYRANAVMKSVFLTPGLHTVEFKYVPQSFKNGLILAAVATILMLLLFLLGKRNDRRTKKPGNS